MRNDFSFKAAVTLLVVIVGLIIYRMYFPPTTFAADGIDPDWDAAVQRSHDASQPMVVLFTADWCPGCRMLHGNILSRSDVQEELRSH